jgi:hypothetical protein
VATLTPHEVAERILACAAAVVTDVERVCVVPGEIAWDDCHCGQLVISETDFFPSSDFPLDEVASQAECGEPWHVVQYTLSLTKCVPVPDSNGQAPTCTELALAASVLSADRRAVRRAVHCCLQALYDQQDSSEEQIEAFQLGHSLTVGPEGACAGHELTIFVGWTNDCGC